MFYHKNHHYFGMEKHQVGHLAVQNALEAISGQYFGKRIALIS